MAAQQSAMVLYPISAWTRCALVGSFAAYPTSYAVCRLAGQHSCTGRPVVCRAWCALSCNMRLCTEQHWCRLLQLEEFTQKQAIQLMQRSMSA